MARNIIVGGIIVKNIQIKPGAFLEGDVVIPPSKSLSHRAIIAAGLAKGNSRIDNLIQSKDIQVTTECMHNLGANFTKRNKGYDVVGMDNQLTLINNQFKCHESGSTLRFMIPIAMLSDEPVVFYGEGKLKTRPLTPYFEMFKEQNIPYNYEASLPLTVEKSFEAGVFKLRGDVSSQFITGLLYTLPLLKETSEIHITSHLESKGYIDLTLDVLKDFGIVIHNDAYEKFIVPGNQQYQAKDYRVEGDYSQIAFWIVAGLINGRLNCLDMNLNSSQGDREVFEIVERMAGNLIKSEEKIRVEKSETIPTVIDGSQCPDIIPVLTVLAAVTPGTTKVINAGRLRIKECDRLKAITEELNKLGADVIELDDGLIIRGKKRLTGGVVKGWNDHRIVMSLTIASLVCDEDVFIEGCDAITKSYPHFFETFKELGGTFNEWHVEE